MGELISTAFAPANLFLTIFLLLILFYWLTVVLGALDMNAIDIDIDTDIDIDANVDIDADADVNHDVSHSGGSGIFLGVLRFFNLGQVPFMVIFSVLILSMWAISVYLNSPNSFINPQMSATWAVILFLPNFIVSMFVTKFVTMPLVPLFRALDSSKQALEMRGQIATLTTPATNNSIGQAKLTVNGSTVTVSVRTIDDQPIERGATVIVIEEIKEERVFIVQRMDKI
jgi:uncharacterized membrane protein (DUF106 family)